MALEKMETPSIPGINTPVELLHRVQFTVNIEGQPFVNPISMGPLFICHHGGKSYSILDFTPHIPQNLAVSKKMESWVFPSQSLHLENPTTRTARDT